MLVLSRKPGEQVVLGDGITLTVVGVRGGRVRLAFDAPARVRVRRAERACRPGEPLDADPGGRTAEPGAAAGDPGSGRARR